MLLGPHGSFPQASVLMQDLAARIRDRYARVDMPTWFPEPAADIARHVLSHPHPDRLCHIADLLDALRLMVETRQHHTAEWLALVGLARSLGMEWADLAEPMGCKPGSKSHAQLAYRRTVIPRARRPGKRAKDESSRPQPGATDRSATSLDQLPGMPANWMQAILDRRAKEQLVRDTAAGVEAFPDHPAAIAAFVLNHRRVHPAVLTADARDALYITVAEYRAADEVWFRLVTHARNLGPDTITWSVLADAMGCTPGSRAAAEGAYARARAAHTTITGHRDRAGASADQRRNEATATWVADHASQILAVARLLSEHSEAFAQAGLILDWIEDIQDCLEQLPSDPGVLGALAAMVFLTGTDATQALADEPDLTCGNEARQALNEAVSITRARDAAHRSTKR